MVNNTQIARINILGILDELGWKLPIMQKVTDAYEEPHRHYHDMWHIKEMLYFVQENYADKLTMDEWDALRIAIIWHDIVLDPTAKDNEENSLKEFAKDWNELPEEIMNLPKWLPIMRMVEEMILATKNHEINKDTHFYVKAIIYADLDRFNLPPNLFWQNTLAIFKEYAQADWGLFKPGRIAFLRSYAPKIKELLGEKAENNCHLSATMLDVWEPKIAVYAGSFDPWHKGHQRVLDKAEKIFDKVIVARGQNPKKPAKTFEMPKELLKTHQVESYEGWITNYMKTKSYPITLIRGLRNGSDLNGEINFSRYLQDLMPEVQIVSIFTDADVEHISSSGIKELMTSNLENDQIPNYGIE